MTQVDFYVMPGEDVTALETLACRIAQKAWDQGNRVYIHTRDPQQASRLDTLLWTFRQNSFLPHQLVDRQEIDDEAPVLIGFGQDPGAATEVMINLAPDVPSFAGRFARVTELVNEHQEIRSKARERYQYYRDRGYPLDTHQLKH